MRRAFTMFELLIVIAIICILAGMLLAVIGPLREQVTGRKTLASFQSILAGLARQSAESGGTVSMAEHPLAGSAAPRARFVRTDGATVATTGEALIGLTALAQLSDAAAQPRLLLPDDRFADPLSPMLFGLPRRALQVVGAPRAGVTAYRRLALPRNVAAIASTDLGGFAVTPSTGTAEHDRACTLALGSDTLESLLADGVAWRPATDTPVSTDTRTWVGEVPRTGRRPGSSALIDGATKPYRLRGVGIYDGWGREILCESVVGGQYRLLSAGRDGCFRFAPGRNGTLDTPAQADAPTGDDLDGQRDNITSSPEPTK